MTDSDEPPDRVRRMIAFTAMGYAIASLLLLGLCCYGIYWANQTLVDFLVGWH